MTEDIKKITEYNILGRALPQNVEFEVAVLGACILETNAVYEIIDTLKPEMFYKEAHSTIFKHILKLFSEDKPIDLLTIAESLKNEKELDKIGGAYYLSALTNNVVSSANIEYHALMIKESYIKRSVLLFSANLQNVVYDKEFFDILDYIDKSVLELFNGCYGKATARTMEATVAEAIKEVEEKVRASRAGKTYGISAGIDKLNNILNGGFQNQKLYVLAGRPAMGKTALMLMFALSALKEGKKPVIYSLEMGAKELSHRIITSELPSNITNLRYKNGWLSDEDLMESIRTAHKVMNNNMIIDDNSTVSVNYLKSSLYRLKKQNKCDIAFIDYLQLMDIPRDKNETKDQAIGHVTRALKALSKDLDMPIILLSQLNRSVETRGEKRPLLADLRESGNIEQDADVVMFVYRDAYYSKDENDKSGEIIIAKHRDGGIGTAYFSFNKSLTKIYELEHSELEPF